ncbi:MAG: hypothetical protein HZC14_03165 [Candidatus Niyogibacteria bacterium]|nr:hypothetical protein [Candidatus Niyogibacteria bacterium]
MINKKTIISILAGLLIILGGVYFQDIIRLLGGGGMVKTVSDDNYMLVIDYGDGHTRKFKGDMEEESAKAWDLLQQASAFGVSVKIEKDFVPRSIDGIANQGDKKWILYINDFRQNKGPFEARAQKGDIVTFKYE